MLKRLLLLLNALLLSSCASLMPTSDSLKVNLSSMQMLESTLMEQRYRIRIRVQNRSRSEMHVVGLSFDLELNGSEFASGVSSQAVTIEPLSEALLSVDLTSTLFGLVRQIRSMQQLQDKPLSYVFSGVFYTSEAAFGIAFKEQGEIDLRPPP